MNFDFQSFHILTSCVLRFQTYDGQYRREKRFDDGKVIGTYGWVDPNNILRLFDYIADDQGYRIVRQRELPVVPTPTPEAETNKISVRTTTTTTTTTTTAKPRTRQRVRTPITRIRNGYQSQSQILRQQQKKRRPVIRTNNNNSPNAIKLTPLFKPSRRKPKPSRKVVTRK